MSRKIFGAVLLMCVLAFFAGSVFASNSGTDEIYATVGTDEIHATEGADEIYPTEGADEIYPTVGTDDIHATEGVDEIYATVGTDDTHATVDTDEIHATLVSTFDFAPLYAVFSHTANTISVYDAEGYMVVFRDNQTEADFWELVEINATVVEHLMYGNFEYFRTRNSAIVDWDSLSVIIHDSEGNKTTIIVDEAIFLSQDWQTHESMRIQAKTDFLCMIANDLEVLDRVPTSVRYDYFGNTIIDVGGGFVIRNSHDFLALVEPMLLESNEIQDLMRDEWVHFPIWAGNFIVPAGISPFYGPEVGPNSQQVGNVWTTLQIGIGQRHFFYASVARLGGQPNNSLGFFLSNIVGSDIRYVNGVNGLRYQIRHVSSRHSVDRYYLRMVGRTQGNTHITLQWHYRRDIR